MTFGKERLKDFSLSAGHRHLNHGAFGATPRAVQAAADAWRRRMEANPSIFFQRDLPPLLRQAAGRVASFLGGRADDWVFVENATAGINAILASLEISLGDEIICLSQCYGAVRAALRHHAERRGARIVVAPVPIPFDDPAPLLDALARLITPRTCLALFDHITSPGGVVLPIGEMSEICRAKGVAVAIDGAHAPGQIPLDVAALGVDFYVANLHKWSFAAKGCGVLWRAPETPRPVHPVVISHGLGQGFAAEFDYCGTRDYAPWLAVPAALDYLGSLDPGAMRAHNHGLARETARMLRDAWGTQAAAGEDFMAAMVSVRLPGDSVADAPAARRLAFDLADRHGVTVAVALLEGALWIRVSAQIYNELSDVERLIDAIHSLRR